MNTPSAIPDNCAQCGTAVQQDASFCVACGIHLSTSSPRVDSEDVFSMLGPSLGYYFVTLILLACYKLTSLFPEGFDGILAITILDIIIVIAFYLYSSEKIHPLFSLAGFNFKIAAVTICGALVGSLLVSWVAEIIQISISDDVFYDMYLFKDTSYPFMMSVLFICVQPAFFEEVAFRGFMMTNLQKLASPWATVVISACLFGFIHLDFVALLWLVPIGLVFAVLRMKYNIIWYGIIGHFTYNLGIILLAFLDIF